MPNPKDFKDQESFMKACIPIVMKEGKTNDQAIGQCMGMWKEKSNTIKIHRYHNIVNIYRKNARTVKGFESPEPGDIPRRP